VVAFLKIFIDLCCMEEDAWHVERFADHVLWRSWWWWWWWWLENTWLMIHGIHFRASLSRIESQESSERIAFPILLSWFLCCPRPAWYSVAFSSLHLCCVESCKWVPVVCTEHSIANHGQGIGKTLYIHGVLVFLSAESSFTIVGLWEFITHDSLLRILHHNPVNCYCS
jgi:hypothetical protein